MNRKELARLLDHSLLKPEATEEDILAQVEVVQEWGIGFFCVQPSYVSLATGALRDSGARVVSVIGFPHGCDRSTVKVHAAELAGREGEEGDALSGREGLDGRYERLADWLHQRRGGERVAPVVAEEADHPALRREPGDVHIQVHAVDALHFQRHVLA
jgi:hypothetical protein